MSLGTKRTKLSKLHKEFSKPVTLTIEEAKVNSQNFDQNPSESHTKKVKEEWKPTPALPSKARYFWNKREPLKSKFDFFIILCKPEGRPKGTRAVFFYSPPLYSVCVDSGIKAELIILGKDSHLYLEGRYLIVIDEGKEYRFSIKSDQKKFAELLNKNFKNNLTAFYVYCKELNLAPEANYLTLYFYQKAVAQIPFYLTLGYFPTKVFTEAFFKNFMYAIDPFIDEFFDEAFYRYYKTCEEPVLFEPEEYVFVFDLIHNIILLDDALTKVIFPALERCNNVLETILSYIELCNINERTKMVLYLLYANTEMYFDADCARSLLSSVVVNVFFRFFEVRNSKSKFAAVSSIRYNMKGKFNDNQFARFKTALSYYEKQPPNFTPATAGTRSYDGFKYLLDITFRNIRVMLKVLKKHPIE
jgi:hypothetical protein